MSLPKSRKNIITGPGSGRVSSTRERSGPGREKLDPAGPYFSLVSNELFVEKIQYLSCFDGGLFLVFFRTDEGCYCARSIDTEQRSR